MFLGLPSAKKCPRCLFTKEATEFWVITRRSGKLRGRVNLSSYCKICQADYLTEWRHTDAPGPKKFLQAKSELSRETYYENLAENQKYHRERYRNMTPEQKAHRTKVQNEYRKRRKETT